MPQFKQGVISEQSGPKSKLKATNAPQKNEQQLTSPKNWGIFCSAVISAPVFK